MRVFLIGEQAPQDSFVLITFGANGPQSFSPETSRFSNALVVESLYSLVDKIGNPEFPIFATLKEAKQRLMQTDRFLYEFELPESSIASSYLSEKPASEYTRRTPQIQKNFLLLDMKKAKLVSVRVGNKRYNVDLDLSTYEPIQFSKFVKVYKEQYSSEWFQNPRSVMKKRFDNRTISNMVDVYQHAYEKPYSRTAKILKQMISQHVLYSEKNAVPTEWNTHPKLSKEHPITLEVFLREYAKQYANEWFTNPLSSMKRLIQSNKITNMEAVYEYAVKNPKSRTAKVLDTIASEKLLHSDLTIEHTLNA